MNDKFRKIILCLPKEVAIKLEHESKKRNLTMSSIITSAVLYYNYLYNHKLDGYKVILEKDTEEYIDRRILNIV